MHGLLALSGVSPQSAGLANNTASAGLQNQAVCGLACRWRGKDSCEKQKGLKSSAVISDCKPEYLLLVVDDTATGLPCTRSQPHGPQEQRSTSSVSNRPSGMLPIMTTLRRRVAPGFDGHFLQAMIGHWTCPGGCWYGGSDGRIERGL
jgi:hypothetical protein